MVIQISTNYRVNYADSCAESGFHLLLVEKSFGIGGFDRAGCRQNSRLFDLECLYACSKGT